MDGVISISAPAGRPARAFLAGLAVLSAAGWAWSLQLASGAHHGLGLVPRAVMWAAMMVGMMVPPEVPMMLGLLAEVGAQGWAAVRRASVVLIGYLAVWTLASVGLAVVDARLTEWGLMSHGMASQSVALSVGILFAAGAVQLSPWKRRCLALCRAAPSWVRAREVGGLRAGVEHGATSLGSCGVLMLVLFVVGAMNVTAMVVLTGFLVAERLLPAPQVRALGWLGGLLLLGWGARLATGALVG